MFAEMWATYSKAILNNIAQYAIYAAIVVLFVAAFLKCVRPVLSSRKQLRRAIRKVKRDESEAVWQDKCFLGKGRLMPKWTEYLNSRLFADDEYHNASPLDDYINEDSVIYEPGFASFAEIVPGLLVSLGFLGTLIGLVMGLSDFNLTDSERVQSSIITLLSGTRYAFMTSIVGVVGSITFSLVTRWAQGSARKTLGRFYDVMQHEARMVTVDPLTQITIYQQEQTALVQALTKDVMNDMSERIGREVERALTPVRESLDNFIEATTQQQLRGLELIVKRFVEHMDGALKGQFASLASMIEETCRWHQDTQDTVRATMDGLTRVSRDIVQVQQLSESLIVKFDGYITRLSAAQQQVDDGYVAVSTYVKNTELVARQQANYISQIGQMQGDFMRDMTSFQATMDSFMKGFVENVNLSTGAMRKVAEELKRSGDGLLKAHGTFSKGVNDDLDRAFGMFDNNMQDIIKQLNYVIGSVKGSVENMPAAIDQASTQFVDQLHQLINVLQDTRAMLDEALYGKQPE